jgi:hypothetical protein
MLRRRTPVTIDQPYVPGGPPAPVSTAQNYSFDGPPQQSYGTQPMPSERTLPYSPVPEPPVIPEGATPDGRGGWSRNTVLPEDQRTPFGRGNRGNGRTPASASASPDGFVPDRPGNDVAAALTPPANYGDYYAPQAQAQQPSSAAMAGWDGAKWSDTSHQTPKYTVGRILSQYPPTVAGLSQSLPEIQRAYPGATFDGKDKIMIPGVGTIDVLQNASQGGTAWQWNDLPELGVTPYTAPPPAGNPGPDDSRPTTRNAIMEQLGLGDRALRTEQYRRPY